ncbi:hypothetical protein CEXT_222821 [Caerostris extrusa]|uniref:Uncharacterized protein n=1 Tax=Caerostris extrusa TaxID=172846 RepID=A0AAV4NL74_CAEEX|nr:hypothetical protein CEXT_222821 [Caerostris extrusa]
MEASSMPYILRRPHIGGLVITGTPFQLLGDGKHTDGRPPRLTFGQQIYAAWLEFPARMKLKFFHLLPKFLNCIISSFQCVSNVFSYFD